MERDCLQDSTDLVGLNCSAVSNTLKTGAFWNSEQGQNCSERESKSVVLPGSQGRICRGRMEKEFCWKTTRLSCLVGLEVPSECLTDIRGYGEYDQFLLKVLCHFLENLLWCAVEN